MTSGGHGAPFSAHAARSASRTCSARSGSPSSSSRPSAPASAREQVSRGGHPGVSGGLCGADALELGRRLRAAALVDRGVVHGEDHAVPAEDVPEPEREVAGHHRLVEADLLHGPGLRLTAGFGPGHPLLDEVPEAEPDVVEELGVGQSALDPVGLEVAREHVAPSIHLREQDRVDDRDRELVAKGSRVLGVAVEQEPSHHASVNRSRAVCDQPLPCVKSRPPSAQSLGGGAFRRGCAHTKPGGIHDPPAEARPPRQPATGGSRRRPARRRRARPGDGRPGRGLCALVRAGRLRDRLAHCAQRAARRRLCRALVQERRLACATRDPRAASQGGPRARGRAQPAHRTSRERAGPRRPAVAALRRTCPRRSSTSTASPSRASAATARRPTRTAKSARRSTSRS